MEPSIVIMGGVYLLLVTVLGLLLGRIIIRERRTNDDLQKELHFSREEIKRMTSLMKNYDWAKTLSDIAKGAFPEPLVAALRYVYEERRRQDEKWGDQSGNHLFEWMSILGEEFGELCEAVNETCFSTEHVKPGRGGYRAIYREAVQVAAVAVAIVESLPPRFEDLKGASHEI